MKRKSSFLDEHSPKLFPIGNRWGCNCSCGWLNESDAGYGSKNDAFLMWRATHVSRLLKKEFQHLFE